MVIKGKIILNTAVTGVRISVVPDSLAGWAQSATGKLLNWQPVLIYWAFVESGYQAEYDLAFAYYASRVARGHAAGCMEINSRAPQGPDPRKKI